MTIHIRNQKPAILHDDPFDVLPNIDPTLDAQEYAEKLDAHLSEKYIEPLFTPIHQNQPVVIEDVDQNNNVQTIDESTVAGAIEHLWDSTTIDVDLQEQVGEIYRQGIQYHAANDWFFEEQIGVEAMTRSKLPLPRNKGGKIIQYSASVDVIPAAKGYLSQNNAMGAIEWFANMTGYTHSSTASNILLVTVQSSAVFDEIKETLRNYTQVWQANHTLSKDVTTLLNDFDKINIANDLSAGLFMPNGGGGSQKEHDVLSFTRMLMYVFAQYEKSHTNGEFAVQPTNLMQLYRPENIMILNLENYARTTAGEIKKDWTALEKALNAKKALNYVSSKKLMTTKAINRSMTQNSSNTADAKQQSMARAKMKRFSGKPVPAKHLLAMMKKVIESQVTKQATQNTYKSHKTSYMRPNRRKPDDINMPGKISTTMYRPDIHVYIDTSGSISEKQYRDAVTNLIMLSKQVDCNLYITSFSHYVSETALLKTKDQSIIDIYKQFQSIPKVAGGTDFEQVWRKIEMLDAHSRMNNRSHQINFVITDFGYSLSRDQRWDASQPEVKHTYYVPVSISPAEWDGVTRMATNFRKQMFKAGDYSIRHRMLM